MCMDLIFRNTVLNIFFNIHSIFDQLALALKKKFTLKFFTVWNVRFTFRIFEQLCACPEKQSLL